MLDEDLDEAEAHHEAGIADDPRVGLVPAFTSVTATAEADTRGPATGG